MKRLFWVVDYITEDDNTSKEIFETREEANKFFEENKGTDISIEEVQHYYKENDGGWNYEEFSDTFTHIITIVHDTKYQLKP